MYSSSWKLLALLLATSALNCGGGYECSECIPEVELWVIFDYEVTSDLRIVINDDVYTKVIEEDGHYPNPYAQSLTIAGNPETLSVQVYEGEVLKLDTTVVPEYQPGIDGCEGTASPSCLVAESEVHVSP